MTRGTLGLRIGGMVVASAVLLGCGSSGQNGGGNRQGRRTTSPSTPAQQPVNPVTAAADIANAAVGAAAGAVNGAISGAVAGANGGAQTSRQRAPRIKRNSRGGYDASELQQDALRRAHALADRYGTIDRSRPAARPANR